MPTGGSSSDNGAAGMPHPGDAAAPPSRPLLRWLGRSTFIMFAAGTLVLGLGFVWFIWRVPADEVSLDRNADGIVALTGGASRIADAIETRRWAESRGFRSLIVVTSNYHMPRALAEIAHQLPGVALVPFPVVTERQRAEPWWSGGTTTRLMVSEYVKYIFARLRMGLNPSAAVGTQAIVKMSAA